MFQFHDNGHRHRNLGRVRIHEIRECSEFLHLLGGSQELCACSKWAPPATEKPSNGFLHAANDIDEGNGAIVDGNARVLA